MMVMMLLLLLLRARALDRLANCTWSQAFGCGLTDLPRLDFARLGMWEVQPYIASRIDRRSSTTDALHREGRHCVAPPRRTTAFLTMHLCLLRSVPYGLCGQWYRGGLLKMLDSPTTWPSSWRPLRWRPWLWLTWPSFVRRTAFNPGGWRDRLLAVGRSCGVV